MMKKWLDSWVKMLAVTLVASAAIACTAAGVERVDIAVDGADAVGIHTIATPSAEVSVPFDVLPGFTLIAANSNSYRDLKPPGDNLNTLLNNVKPRIIIQGANSNHYLDLSYPEHMLVDDGPPEVNKVEILTWHEDGFEISWSTDKDAHSVVRCETIPDVFQEVPSELLYLRDHHITVRGLKEGSAYNCRACSTDPAGNRSTGYGFRVWLDGKLLTAWEVAPCR
jgi:hypothetical protein